MARFAPLPWEKGLRLPLRFPAEKPFQGPLADAPTHFGQIALLLRLAGEPVRSENQFRTDIDAGRLGPEQSASLRKFDQSLATVP